MPRLNFICFIILSVHRLQGYYAFSCHPFPQGVLHIIMKSTWDKHNKGTLGQPSHRSLLVSPGGGGTDGGSVKK